MELKNNSIIDYSDCTVIIPTFFPDDDIFDCINSLPKSIKILIIDNSYDQRLLNKIKIFSNCTYYNIGDVGLGKTFNFALTLVKTNYILLTQPDVVLSKNCLENLIKGINNYPKAGMVAPIVFDNGVYSKYDFYDLKYNKKKKFFQHDFKKKISILPAGDFCVDAINATTMLIRRDILLKINGWDENIYVYLEDIDLCLRMYLAGFCIVKISNAKVDHKGWSSHFSSIKDTMNISRIWHFTWSSIYFNFKFCNKFFAYKILISIFLKSFFKLILNLFLNKKKYQKNKIKLSACLAIIMERGSYFRVKHKTD